MNRRWLGIKSDVWANSAEEEEEEGDEGDEVEE